MSILNRDLWASQYGESGGAMVVGLCRHDEDIYIIVTAPEPEIA